MFGGDHRCSVVGLWLVVLAWKLFGGCLIVVFSSSFASASVVVSGCLLVVWWLLGIVVRWLFDGCLC